MIRQSDAKRANVVLAACALFNLVIVLMLLWGEWRKDGWERGATQRVPGEEREPTQVLPSPADQHDQNFVGGYID